MLIGLLHSVVPHQHHTAESSDSHCTLNAEDLHQDHGLLDWLGDFFHLSPGNDHLENLRKSDSKTVDVDAIAAVLSPQACISLFSRTQTQTLLPIGDMPLVKSLSRAVRPLRGPPSLL